MRRQARRSHPSTVLQLAGMFCVLASFSCEGRRDGERPTIARVGEHPLYAGDLSGARDLAARRRSLDAAIARILAADAARARGVADRGEVQAKLDALRRRALASEETLLRDALFQTVRDELQPTDADLHAHYEATKLRYAERQVRLRWWPLPSADAARAAAAAKAQSLALSLEKAESIGPIAPSDFPAKVVPEVFHLSKVGDRLAAGSEAEGFGVVELVEILPAVTLPFEAVRGRVEESWRTLEGQRAFAKLIAELRAKADIEIDEAALANDALWAEPDAESASPSPPR